MYEKVAYWFDIMGPELKHPNVLSETSITWIKQVLS
jgi:hypothetical protein